MARNVKPPEERRQELIDVALTLFAEKGYEATSVRDILKEVNGAPGMFYYYFSSKEEIFKAAINQYIDRYIKELNEVLLDQSLSIPKRISGAMDKFKQTFMYFTQLSKQQSSPINGNFHIQLSQQILKSLVAPFSVILYDALENDFIDSTKTKKEEIPQLAMFLVYGIYGFMNYSYSEENSNDAYQLKIQQLPLYIARILGIPVEKLF